MKLWRVETQQREVEVFDGTRCDGCGRVFPEDHVPSLIEVFVSVNPGQAYGGEDFLDFCDTCFTGRCAALVAVGSTAELVKGTAE